MAKFKTPVLRPFIRRLRFESFLKSLFVALAAGVVASFTALVVMWLLSATNWIVFAVVFAAATVVVGVVSYFVIYRLSMHDIIRRIDEAGLQERLTTMEELWDDQSYIAQLQRQDTMRRIKALKPRAVRLALPLISGIILLSMSVISAAAAFIPQPQRRVTVDEAIFDDYKIIIPAVNDLPNKLYQAVEQLPETLPETLRDELDEIIKDIEDLNGSIQDGTDGGDMDNIADLEDKIDRLDQILNENVKGPLLSDFMKSYTSLRPLSNALKSAKPVDIHNALYGWCLGFTEQVEQVLATVESSKITPAVKDALVVQLSTLLSRIENKTQSFSGDRGEVASFAAALDAEMTATIFAVDCIERLLGNTADGGALSAALLAGDKDAVQVALDQLEAALYDDAGVIQKTAVESLIASLAAAMDTTSDRPSGGEYIDPAWTAVQNLHGKLGQVIILAGTEEQIAKERLAEAFLFARAEFEESVSVNAEDLRVYQETTDALDYIRNGRYLFAYLWNDPANPAYVDTMEPGIAVCLRKVLEDDCGFGANGIQYYTESVLVNALYKLLTGLETAAKNALLNNGNHDAIYDLYGATRPTDDGGIKEHVTHTENNPIPVACNEIVDALTAEKQIEDVIEDMKDQIQDAIDDLLNPDEEKGDEDAPGIDAPPEEPPQGGTPPEGGESSDSNENQQPDDTQQQPGPGGSNTGKEDLSGMTFFNPNTGTEETLSQERLEEFKAALDKAIEEGSYSQEQQTQMNRYYEYLLQKFSQK